MDKMNRMEQQLRQSLSGKPSSLPDGMLNRILTEKKRRRRIVLWWWYGSFAFLLLIASAFWANYFSSQSETQMVTGTASNSPKKPGATGKSNPAMGSAGTSANAAVSTSSGTESNVQSNHEKANTLAPSFSASQEKPLQASGSSANTPGNGSSPKPADKPGNSGKTESVPTEHQSPKPSTPIVAERHETPLPADTPEIHSIPAIAVEDTSDITIVTAEVVANTPANPNKGKHSAKDSMIPRPLFFATVSQVWETQSISMDGNDSNGHFHRDFLSILQAAAKPSSGIQLSLGYQFSPLKHWSISAGFQYSRMQQNFDFNYEVKDFPVVDVDGNIKGYGMLPDSMRFIVHSNKTVNYQSVMLPIQFGFQYYLTPKYLATATVCITPQMFIGGSFVLPDRLTLEGFGLVSASKVLNMPVSLGAGLFRETQRFRFGIQCKMNPGMFAMKNTYEGIVLKRSRYDVGLTLGYKLN